MQTETPPAADRCSSDRGAGLMGSAFGVLVFLILLLTSAQILYGLYARSIVTDAAFDAARKVAGYDGSANAIGPGQAEAELRATLGEFGATATIRWISTGGDDIVLQVSGPTPSFLPAGFSGRLPVDSVNTTVRVRNEQFIEAAG